MHSPASVVGLVVVVLAVAVVLLVRGVSVVVVVRVRASRLVASPGSAAAAPPPVCSAFLAIQEVAMARPARPQYAPMRRLRLPFGHRKPLAVLNLCWPAGATSVLPIVVSFWPPVATRGRWPYHAVPVPYALRRNQRASLLRGALSEKGVGGHHDGRPRLSVIGVDVIGVDEAAGASVMLPVSLSLSCHVIRFVLSVASLRLCLIFRPPQAAIRVGGSLCRNP